ncbi:MAG: hypothetical protein ACTH6N_09470, partial [Brachybacterium tyrofermentans]
VLQWLAMLVWVVGLGWLALNVVLVFFQIPPPPMPMIQELWIPIPLPTALLVLGIAVGILLGLLGGALAAVTASWYRRRARGVLLGRVREVALTHVVAEVEETLSRADSVARDIAFARG